MRGRLCFMLAVLFVAFSSLQLQAQIPYLSTKATLGTTLTSGDFSAFAPQGDYTLEAAMTTGQVINVGNANRLGFTYTAKADGLHRFMVQGLTVYVFNDNVLVETITDHSELFPNIFSGTTDDSSAKTGIYSELNLFKNPGFEENDLFAGYNTGNAPRGNPKYWDVPASYDIATLCRTHNMTTDAAYTVLKTTAGAEGNWAYMVHQDVIPMWQKLDEIKAGTWYKATYRQMTHKDNSNASAMAVYLAKNPEGAIDAENALSVYNYYASTGQNNAMGNFKDITYYFKTPDEIPADGLYFVIKRTGIKNHLAHYDRMTLVEANPSTVGITAAGISEITYEAGAIPPAQLTTGQYYDMTRFVKNPNMDTATDWINTSPAQNKTIANNQYGDFTGCFYENWNPSNFGTGKIYQVVAGLPNGTYQLKAAAFADKSGEGVFIYGNDKKTAANTSTPTFQTVNFSVVNGTAEVGLVVEQATNQWIGLDDVRLYYFGQDAAFLADAIIALDAAVATATDLKAEKTGTTDLNLLDAALTQAEEAKTAATAAAVDAALTALNSAIAKAQATVAVYASLNTAIEAVNAKKADYAEFSGFTAFEEVIAAAQDVYNTATADSVSVFASITTLSKAEITCRFTQAAPFDASFLIVNPNFTKEGGDITLAADALSTGWTSQRVAADGDFRLNTLAGKNCWNSWSNNFTSMDLFQKLEGVPAGIYKMTAYTLTDGDPHDQRLYAVTSTGTAVSPVATLKTVNPNLAWEELSTTEFIVGADGKLQIGMRSTSGGGTSGWFSATGFTLTCLSAATAPVAPKLPTFPEAAVPASTDPVVTGDYVIYHPASKKLLANNNAGTYVALSDYSYIENREAYEWTLTVSGENNDNFTMQQLSSGKYANTTTANAWDMVFDSPRADAWLLKPVEGGYNLASLVKSTSNVIGVDGLTANPLGVYINKGSSNNPLFRIIDKATFLAVPEIAAYNTQLEAYFAAKGIYDTELTLYTAQKDLADAITAANAILLTDAARYKDASKTEFTEAISAASAVYMNSESTLEELQAALPELKAAQTTYRLSIIAAEDNPADFTFMIVNPTMDNTTGWVTTTDAQNKGLANEPADRQIAFNGTFLENWKPSIMGAGKVSQTITGLPKGKYLFRMAAFILNPKEGFFLMANDAETPIMDPDPAYNEVEVNVMNGTLELGVRINANTTNWFGIDNASLKYLGYGVGTLIETLNAEIEKAKAIESEPMQASVADALGDAIDAGLEANEETPIEDLETVITTLKETIADAKISIAAYADMKAAITAAEASDVAEEANVIAAIVTATEVYSDAEVDAEGIKAAITALRLAVNTAIVAGSENGDCTLLIANPGFETFTGDRDQSISGWTKTGTSGTEYGIRTNADGPAGKTGTGYFQHWGTNRLDFSISQILADIPNGVYELVAFAGGNAGTTGTYVYANDKNVEVTADKDYSITLTVVENSLTIGFKSESRSVDWAYADNFRLTYHGTEAEYAAKLTAALDVLTDSLTSAKRMRDTEAIAALIVKAEMNKVKKAITDGEAVTESTTLAPVTSAIASLVTAIDAANASIDLCVELAVLFGKAQGLLAEHHPVVDGTALQTLLTAKKEMYDNQTDATDNAALTAAITELTAAIEAYEAAIETQGPGDGIIETGIDGVDIYVDGSSIIVEGAEYELYTEGGILVAKDAQLVSGIYIVKIGDKSVKVQVN